MGDENRYFLHSSRIGMRLLNDFDVDYYMNWFNDEEVCRYNSHHRYPQTKEKMLKYINNVNASETAIVFALVDKESGIHFGNISIQSIDYINRSAEIAYILGDKSFWGKGYATEASKVIMEHAFFELNLCRIYLATPEDNIGMIKVAKKLGFKEEGRRRNAIFKNNSYLNLIEFGLLKEEYISENEVL